MLGSLSSRAAGVHRTTGVALAPFGSHLRQYMGFLEEIRVAENTGVVCATGHLTADVPEPGNKIYFINILIIQQLVPTK